MIYIHEGPHSALYNDQLMVSSTNRQPTKSDMHNALLVTDMIYINKGPHSALYNGQLTVFSKKRQPTKSDMHNALPSKASTGTLYRQLVRPVEHNTLTLLPLVSTALCIHTHLHTGKCSLNEGVYRVEMSTVMHAGALRKKFYVYCYVYCYVNENSITCHIQANKEHNLVYYLGFSVYFRERQAINWNNEQLPNVHGKRKVEIKWNYAIMVISTRAVLAVIMAIKLNKALSASMAARLPSPQRSITCRCKESRRIQKSHNFSKTNYLKQLKIKDNYNDNYGSVEISTRDVFAVINITTILSFPNPTRHFRVDRSSTRRRNEPRRPKQKAQSNT